MSKQTESKLDADNSVQTHRARAFPKRFNLVLLIAAWQTYRIVGAVFWGDLEFAGGEKLPDAWAIPLSQDAIIGILAPLVVYRLAMRPNVLSYALGIAWFALGIVDFTNGIVVEALYPPTATLLGENIPAAFLTGWLVVNMLVEISALLVMLSPAMRRYFIEAQETGQLSFGQSPMAGKWIVAIVVAALNGIFFKTIGAGLNAMFGWWV